MHIQILQNDIESLVVHQLLDGGPLTVKELWDIISKNNPSIAVRSIYRAIKDLEEKLVITKLKTYCILDTGWVAQQAEYWQQAFNSHIKHNALDMLIPENSNKNRWNFTNLGFANLFFLQIMLSLIHQDKTKVKYGFIYHPWFYYLSEGAELRFNQAIKNWGGLIYRIIGGTTKLDQEPLAMWEEVPGKNIFGESVFSNMKGTSLVLIGDYILTLELRKPFAELIDQFYINAEKIKKAEPPQLTALLSKNDKFTVELIRSPEKAKALKKKFDSHLGI